jgi:uncharacterized protein YjbJ (UPF0337 family)
MKSSTRDRIRGSFHEVKGAIKEEAGKLTNNRTLEVKGNVEKTAGKVQHHIGDTTKAVTSLRKQLEQFAR